MTTRLSAACTLALPEGYSTADMLAYQLRDAQHLSETGNAQALQKALMYQGVPSLLTLSFTPQQVKAEWQLGPATSHPAAKEAMAALADGPALNTQLDCMVSRMLGLQQDIQPFEQACLAHAELGPLISRQRGLRVAATATPFEALVWAIVGQQISVQAAVSIRRRLIQATGLPQASGLWAHPDAAMLARQPLQRLRDAGLSQAKASTLQTVSNMVVDNALPLNSWLQHPNPSWASFREALLAIRGIGPWTADYTLLRGYGWLDGSLHGDVAVRRSLARLLGSETPLTADFTRQWLQEFTPWKALVGAHLWAANKIQA